MRMTLAALCAACVIGGVFLVAHSTASKTNASPSDQARYAEVPSDATPGPAATTTADAPRAPAVPIVVYHIVRPPYPDDSPAVRALAQTPEIFGAQLAYLANAGYHVVSFAALESHIASSTPLPSRPIVISFDDGWRDQFEYAFPILKEHGDTATFFVFTNAIDRPGFLSWDNLREMQHAGMTIASHSRSHPFLLKISDPAALREEIAGSKRLLEERLGASVTEFAYPFGQYDATTTALVREAGYRAARGDYVKKGEMQSPAELYTLGALNAPTSLELFMRAFPAR